MNMNHPVTFPGLFFIFQGFSLIHTCIARVSVNQKNDGFFLIDFAEARPYSGIIIYEMTPKEDNPEFIRFLLFQ